MIFQFCNVLATFYYLAFAARYVPKHNQPEESIGECGFDSCMIPLAVNTLVIMSTEVGWRWISRFLWPYVSYHVLSSCCGMYSERRAEDHAYNPYAAILQNAPSAYNRDKMQSSFYSSPSKSMKKEEEADFNMGAIYGAGSDDEEQNRKPTVTSPTSKKFTISSPSKKVQNPHPSDSFYNPSLSADNLAQSPPASPTRSLTRNKSMMSERSNADDRSVVSTKDSPMRRQLAAAIAAERNKKEGKPASSVVGSSLSSKTSFQPAPVEVRSPAPLAPISPMAASDDNANNQNNSSNRTEASHQFSNPMRANIAKYAIVKPPVQQNSSVTGGSALHVIVEEKDAQSEVDHKSAGIPSLQKPALSSGNRKESTFFNADSEARSPHSPQDWQSYVNAQQSVKLVQRADRNKSLRERSAFSRSMDDDETQLESAELGKGVGGENNAESDEDVAQDYDVMNPFESFTTHNYDYLREGLDNYSQFIRILLITICFGSSLPAVFLIFLVYVGIEIRGQTWLLCFHYPRPLPEVCEDIGVWMAIFQVVLAIGTFTNASLVILTMDQFQHWPIAYRLALWIGYAVVLLAYQFFLHKVYHGIPSEVLIQKQRALFLSTQLNSSSNAKATEYDQQAIATEML